MTLRLERTTAVESDITAEQLKTYGALSTSGNQIVVDETGEVVRITGVNWHGAEGVTFVPNGLWARNYKDMLDQIAETGYNLIRLPVSSEVLRAPDSTGAVNLQLNPDFRDLTAIEMIDEIIAYAGQIGLRVMIDMHRRDPGVGKQEDGLWFDEDYTEDDLIADWQALAGRYAGDPTVAAVDVFNEPSGQARWSMDDPRTPPANGATHAWADAAERIGNAILEVNPDVLVFVEGVHIVDTKFYWVGGNLRGVAFDPVELEVDNKLVYSPHDYPDTVRNVPWLFPGITVEELEANWDTNWGFIFDENIAPVVIGETGGRLADLPADTEFLSDDVYFGALSDYLEASAGGGDGGIGVIWWTWGPNSFDTKGILLDDWSTVDEAKVDILRPYFSSLLPTTERAARELNDVAAVVMLSSDTSEPWNRAYRYETIDLTAEAGSDYYAESGIFHFGAYETQATTDLTLISDDVAESRETFLVRVTAVDGTPLGLERVTLLDDDTVGAANSEADPLVFVGSEMRSPGTWTIRLEAKDTPDPALSLQNWSSQFYSDLFDLSAPVKGTLTPDGTDEAIYNLETQITNGKFTNTLTATLKDGVTLSDVVGFETTLLFAVPTEEVDPGVDPNLFSPTGKLLTGNAQALIEMDITQTYGMDFFARVTITNFTEDVLEDWELRFRGPFEVNSLSKVTVLEEDEEWTFVQAPTWNNDLEVGESFTFGISGTANLTPADHIVAYDTLFF